MHLGRENIAPKIGSSIIEKAIAFYNQRNYKDSSDEVKLELFLTGGLFWSNTYDQISSDPDTKKGRNLTVIGFSS